MHGCVPKRFCRDDFKGKLMGEAMGNSLCISLETNSWEQCKSSVKLFNGNLGISMVPFLYFHPHSPIGMKLPNVHIWSRKTQTSCWSFCWGEVRWRWSNSANVSLSSDLPNPGGPSWVLGLPPTPRAQLASATQVKGPTCKLQACQPGEEVSRAAYRQTPMDGPCICAKNEESRNQTRKDFYKEILLH